MLVIIINSYCFVLITDHEKTQKPDNFLLLNRVCFENKLFTKRKKNVHTLYSWLDI